MILGLYLVGAVVIGYFFGFAYSKLKAQEKYQPQIKSLGKSINERNIEKMALKKEVREANRENIHLKNELETSNTLAISLQKDIKEKDETILTLEETILNIQDEYEILNTELKKTREEYTRSLDKLTKKANHLFALKNSKELSNAKEVFNTLRDNALKD